jgi:benzoylformate decarboxylase
MNGIQAFLEVLAAAGIDRIFGNPGTTELPLNDALAADRRFDYVLGIHEIPVVSMADGYAMATRQVAVISVHIACGLGNAMGMLYNAHIEGTPLLLTVGQQDRRLSLAQPVLWGELTRVVQPWTKWAYEVQRPEDIATATRRAIQIAMTPPTGPVFLALPVDVQTAEVEACETPWRPATLATRVRPDRRAIERVAACLADARSPIILAGSRVTESGSGEETIACDYLATLAEHLDATIVTEATSSHGRLPVDSSHPLYGGRLPLWSNDIRSLLDPHDVVLAIGLDLFRLYIHDEAVECPFDAAKLWIQLDSNAAQLAKNFPVQHAVLGDVEYVLEDLLADVKTRLPLNEYKRQRLKQRRETREGQLAVSRKELAKQWDIMPMSPEVLMAAIIRALPEDAAIVEEAVTTHCNQLEWFGVIRKPQRFFAHRGWALGWGIGCALGVQLAWPQTPVVGIIGDGAALYGIQGLWTAARYGIPVVFVICNNRQYKILKECSQKMPLPRFEEHGYPGMDLDNPNIDFVKLSESFGVAAKRVSSADQVVDQLRSAFARREPFLLDVAISD